ncbi:MAG: YdcF family protein [Leptolyngbyaceae cyanobacterium SM2_3_12]|nr:YdcF family protein [Leptolyngbyaceae cyanobacterium SM2_3_12]
MSPRSGQPADAIVVLARNSDIQGDRYSTAIRMVEQGRAAKLLIMGRVQGVKVFEQLQQRQLPADGLLSAVCVRTTKQEAYSAAAALGPRGLHKIILITDPPHMLRAWLSFKSLGFTVVPHIEPIPQWVAHHERSFLAIREYFGLLSYAALGRFQPPPPNSLVQPKPAIAEDLPPDSCFINAEQIQQSISPG